MLLHWQFDNVHWSLKHRWHTRGNLGCNTAGNIPGICYSGGWHTWHQCSFVWSGSLHCRLKCCWCDCFGSCTQHEQLLSQGWLRHWCEHVKTLMYDMMFLQLFPLNVLTADMSVYQIRLPCGTPHTGGRESYSMEASHADTSCSA